MIPIKYAFSDMKSAARPRNDMTKLRALATGLRLRTTAAPKINVSKAKIQNRNGDMSYLSGAVMEQWRDEFLSPVGTPLLQYSITLVLLISSCSISTRHRALLRRSRAVCPCDAPSLRACSR